MSKEFSTDAAPVIVEHNGTPLDGQVYLPGGKHAFAHVLASAALAQHVELDNVPANSDSVALIDALHLVFEHVEHDREARRLRLSCPMPAGVAEWPASLVKRSRNLFCLLPATLHHRGRLRFTGLPTGCEIGVRPSDWYLRTMEKYGVEVKSENGSIDLKWHRRHPARLSFDYPTMTGTVIALAAAAAVPGFSEIAGGTAEPSCWEQAEAMTANGRVVSRGRRTVVEGNGHLERFRWRLGPDRIHAVTLLTAGLLTRGRATVEFDRQLGIPRFLEFCDQIGADIVERPNTLTISHPRNHVLRATDLVAGPEPLFSTDWAPFAALLLACRAEGRSSVEDEAFVDRFQFLKQLRPAGLKQVSVTRSHRNGRDIATAELKGEPDICLRGTAFGDIPDIRGSAAALLSSLVADGPCSIPNSRHLLRGYEDLPGQLRKLGVRPPIRKES